MTDRKRKTRKIGLSYILSRIIILTLVVLTFYPLYTLINMSLKPNVLIQVDFLGFTRFDFFDNYRKAAKYIIRPVANSFFICTSVIVITTLIISLAGYAFGKMKFYGKELFYNLILVVLMIPGVMMIIPNFQIVYKMGFVGSYLGLIIPYIAGTQLWGIVIVRSFCAELPDDMFESGKIDGASEIYLYIKIALPLSIPSLITAGIISFISMYNDYIWPTIILSGEPLKSTFCQIAFNTAGGNGATDLGYLAAFFILGTIPLFAITASCLKYYLQGMLEGAVKG